MRNKTHKAWQLPMTDEDKEMLKKGETMVPNTQDKERDEVKEYTKQHGWKRDVEKDEYIDKAKRMYGGRIVEVDEYMDSGIQRKFCTGATRDTAEGKLDYEGFLSPRVLEMYAIYMNKNRVQSDGSIRPSDNWQKGIPKRVYMASAWRHFLDMWKEHRGLHTEGGMVEALCGLLFNVMGYMHEVSKDVENSNEAEERGG